MKTHKYKGLKPCGLSFCRFLVLVPQPETRLAMRTWCAQLFNAGLDGAWSFPCVAPLAVLSRPLIPAELKQYAALLRLHNPCAMNDYKITGSAPLAAAFPCGNAQAKGALCCKLSMNSEIYGPLLDFTIPDSVISASKSTALWFNQLVLGAALVSKGFSACKGEANKNIGLIKAPKPGFRAAAIANMSYKALTGENSYAGSEYSYKWTIGHLFWLPKTVA